MTNMNPYSHTVVDWLYQSLMNTGMSATADDFVRKFSVKGYWHSTGSASNALCGFLASLLNEEDSELRLCLCPSTPPHDLVSEIMEMVIPKLVERNILGGQ